METPNLMVQELTGGGIESTKNNEGTGRLYTIKASGIFVESGLKSCNLYLICRLYKKKKRNWLTRKLFREEKYTYNIYCPSIKWSLVYYDSKLKFNLLLSNIRIIFEAAIKLLNEKAMNISETDDYLTRRLRELIK